MSIATRVTIKSDSVLAVLSRLALDPTDKRGLLNDIGVGLADNTRIRFVDQRSPDGDPWVPSLRALAEGGETLRDTGRLMASITHNVLPDGVEVGTNVPYAAPLHFGATIRPTAGQYLRFPVPGAGWATVSEVELPARPFLGLDADDEQYVVDVVSQFLNTPTGR